MTTPEVVDLYLRKSTKDEGRSVDRQLAELTDAAADEGLKIGHRIFIDPDFSASRYRRRERPDFAALVAHIESGQCRIVGILEASRGSRDLTEWSAFLDLCRKRNVRIWVRSHDRIYDLSRRRDWRALADEGLDAADESEKISERVQSGKRKAAREGKPPGRLAYGFTRTYNAKGKFLKQLPHPEQAPIVAEMVRRVADGEKLFGIAADLNERGITMPGGSPWAGRFVRQTVLRPAYAGRRIHRGEDIGPAAWEPIVDVDQWRKAKAILTRSERRSTTRGTALSHWLTGVALCGGCRRSRLVAKTQGASGRPMRYMCEGCGKVFISGKHLEDVIEGMILARLAQPDAKIRRKGGHTVHTLEVEAEIDRLQQRLDEHYAEARAGRLSARGLTIVEAGILADIEVERAKVRRADSSDDLDVEPAEVIAGWPDYPPARRRRVVLWWAEIIVLPALRRGPGFDVRRIFESRWAGDSVTWGELYEVGR